MNRIERVALTDPRPAPVPRGLSRTRRSLPPELIHAIDLERLSWTLQLKGVPAAHVAMIARPRRMGVCLRPPESLAPGPVLGLGTALSEIDRLWPAPSLSPREPGLRTRAQAIERWLAGEVAASVLLSLVQVVGGRRRGQQAAAHQLIMDPASADVIRRAFDLISGLTQRHAYVLGDELSFVDLTAAAVLAPIARKEGWVWAGHGWPPLSAVAGRCELAQHRGAAWVRGIYERHARQRVVTPHSSHSWLP
ncbi:MAG: hypothetical protein SFV19_10085 [Rhodospirillaceae bacterium]|nr:hypothetical protein [Rhodospirillaceae bacterium]